MDRSELSKVVALDKHLTKLEKAEDLMLRFGGRLYVRISDTRGTLPSTRESRIDPDKSILIMDHMSESTKRKMVSAIMSILMEDIGDKQRFIDEA